MKVALKLIVAVITLQLSQLSLATEKPLNVLFILTDDQTQDTVHALGNNRIATPNIDQLAQQGLSFSHVFNQGAWSAAVCAPSRGMINSGRNLYSAAFGPKFASNSLPMGKVSLFGETFKNAGYSTFMTGKWHLPMQAWTRSFTHGKAVFKGGMSSINAGGHYKANFVDYDAANTEQPFKAYKGNKHTSEMIADAAVDFIDNKAGTDKPFMMYVAFLAPHDPRQAPQEYIDRYPSESIKLPNSFIGEHPFDQGDHKIRDEKLADFPRKPGVVKQFIADYYAMIEHTDTQIGRVIASLEKSGLADNTLIVFTSDHGLAVGKHGLLGKQNQYDHSIRVPFIVKGPNLPVNEVKPGMFYLNSIFPTTLELAGLAIPDTVQAKSVANLITGEELQLYSSIFSAYRQFQRMVRTDDYKLIYYPHLDKTQLFDLKNDPDELVDISNDKKYADTLVSLQAELVSLQTEFQDPLIDNDIKAYLKIPGVVRVKKNKKAKTSH